MAKTKEILVNGQLTQVTEFDHSAQEIDDAVGKVNGGYATPIADARTATKTGLYYIGNVDPATSHVPFKYVMLEVKAQSDRFIVQYLWRWNAQGHKMKCVYDSGTWGEWEWENPPMELGVEYRTTERYMGKPVYTMLVDFGTMPNSTTKDVTFSTDTSIRSFDVTGEMHNGSSLVRDGVGIRAIENKVRITTTSDYSSYKARLAVKYYKNTD